MLVLYRRKVRQSSAEPTFGHVVLTAFRRRIFDDIGGLLFCANENQSSAVGSNFFQNSEACLRCATVF